MKRRRFNQKLHLHYQETLTTRFQCCARKIYRKGELLGTRAFARAYLRSAERKNNLQIATEIKFLWNNNGLHRDIKLSNLFLSADMTVKKEISGWSILLPIKENLCGTANFICPEVLNGQGHSVGSEHWSVGCVIYALLCGKASLSSDCRPQPCSRSRTGPGQEGVKADRLCKVC